MTMQKGQLSIHAENLLPIIKKWLYSDKDIFVRELVANGCDAISKYKALFPPQENLCVRIGVDREKKTITISDNGIGMTAQEIDRYINQVAFSGAQEFIEKLEKTGAQADAIIGHFGLGFYSAFMVSDKVVIDTLSSQEGAQSAQWSSDGGLEFEMGPGSRQEHGTDIVLHVASDSEEYLDEAKIRQIAAQYLAFMPVPIFIGEDQSPVNDTEPLYLKQPKDITDEQYIEFYKKTFSTWEDPLFWVHLNIDFPFNLKGILYFPKINDEYRVSDGCVKLVCRQVYVAENIKEIIPEYLLLLKGVIDSPDIPLNVSRSFLQNDSEVKKLSAHISRKVADRLNALHTSEPDRYDTVWDDISLFVKFGCMRDDKFYDRVKPSLIFKTVSSESWSLETLKEKAKAHDGVIYYAGEGNRAMPVVDYYTEKGIDVVYLDTPIDVHFVSFLEFKEQDLKLKRVDSDLAQEMSEGQAEETQREKAEKLVREAMGDDHLSVKLERLGDQTLPAVLTVDEQMRRMSESNRMFGGEFEMPLPTTVVLNANNAVVARLLALETPGEQDYETVRQIYDLAMLARGTLGKDRLAAFIRRSCEMLS